MKRRRAGFATKIIVISLIAYALISLVNLQGRIDEARKELSEVRRLVAEKELSNAELEYEIENHNDPSVIAGIARSELGLVLPGEMVFFDGGNVTEAAD